MAKEDYYKVGKIIRNKNVSFLIQDLFQKIDLEDDGIVYLREIVIYLRAMNEDIDVNLEVNFF